MGTYSHEKILTDYANGQMDVEMAMGHVLQHLDKLYALQTNANLNRYALRGRLDDLETLLTALQTELSQVKKHCCSDE